jgi:hypothetical protein
MTPLLLLFVLAALAVHAQWNAPNLRHSRSLLVKGVKSHSWQNFPSSAEENGDDIDVDDDVTEGNDPDGNDFDPFTDVPEAEDTDFQDWENDQQAQEEEIEEEEEEEQELEDDPNIAPSEPNRRRFVSYQQSEWEQYWFNQLSRFTAASELCKEIMNSPQLEEYLDLLCITRAPEPHEKWCYFHDYNAHFMWFNSDSSNFQVYVDSLPPELQDVPDLPAKPNSVNFEDTERWDKIASKFIFNDDKTGEEYYEYIEPLVGHLRFPVAGCLVNYPELFDFPSYVIPPPNFDHVDGRKVLYDVGSKDWSRMQYLMEEWRAHGLDHFDFILSYATSEDDADSGDLFMSTVNSPPDTTVHRNHADLVGQPSDDPSQLFLLDVISDQTRQEDYVILKLDRANANLKQHLVIYLMEHPEVHVDEVLWEMNANGNTALQPWFDHNLNFDEIANMSIEDAYKMLLHLRFRGVRSHSWV